MLTGKELAASGIIKGFDEKYIQQEGIDIRVAKISKIKKGDVGCIPAEGKTYIPSYETIEPLHLRKGEQKVYGWMLPVGVYDVEYIEGIDVPAGKACKPISRSSLVRCGCRVDSGLFDPGFHSEHMGSMLFVNSPIVLEVGARLAQVVCLESNEVDNLYDGQWQGDNQRIKKEA